jgi:HPr kinase/phosphorylase
VVGFLNLIHPNKVQVLGLEESDYLAGLDQKELTTTVSRILASAPLAIIVGDGLAMHESILRDARGGRTALLRSDLRAHELVNYLQYHIARSLARHTTMHGVFMEVFTIGVLITGSPGCGKSELALDLLTRGHRLIADDAPEFTQISPEIIDGTCPEELQDCLEVRGLGVLNVRDMFGDSAVKANKFLRLIIHRKSRTSLPYQQKGDRLHGDTSSQAVLDLQIPRITLPVMAGRTRRSDRGPCGLHAQAEGATMPRLLHRAPCAPPAQTGEAPGLSGSVAGKHLVLVTGLSGGGNRPPCGRSRTSATTCRQPARRAAAEFAAHEPWPGDLFEGCPRHRRALAGTGPHDIPVWLDSLSGSGILCQMLFPRPTARPSSSGSAKPAGAP